MPCFCYRLIAWPPDLPAGITIARGPVRAPEGVFVLGMLPAETPEVVAALAAAGPALAAGPGFGRRIDPMPSLLHQ